MIDTHCHLLDTNCIPESYFRRFLIDRHQVKSVSNIAKSVIPWSKNDYFSQVAALLKIANLPMNEKFERLRSYYPDDTLFVPLMIDYEFGMKGKMATSYEEQIRWFVKLKDQNPDTVFPFLGVDPRRDNVFNLVKKYVGKNKPFQGIKIYPGNGFLPSHPDLMDVFEYCESRRIPVTTHCADEGMGSDDKKTHVRGHHIHRQDTDTFSRTVQFRDSARLFEYFCDPVQWLPVLDRFPKLVLDLAHFGGLRHFGYYQKGRMGNWTDKIINMMMKYENVYTDISYIISRKSVFPTIKKLLRSPFRHKILFGTDYYIVLYKGYFNHILNSCFVEFSKSEFSLIADINPRRFLFAEKKTGPRR